MPLPKKTLKKLLGGLRSKTAAGRDLAAAELGDYLGADYIGDGDFPTSMHALLTAALAEKNETAKESMFNALSIAAELPRAAHWDWSPIVAELPNLAPDCLEHALYLLGYSGNVAYRPFVEPYRTHRDADVRTAAKEALRMLSAEENQPLAKAAKN
jgi:hypothetical protein